MRDLDFGGVDGDAVGGSDGEIVIVDGAEAVDNFGGGLETPEKWRNEDPMDREINGRAAGPELPTASKSPVFSILG